MISFSAFFLRELRYLTWRSAGLRWLQEESWAGWGLFFWNTWGLRKCPRFWGNWNGKGGRVTTLPPPKKKVWYWYSLKSYLNLKNDGTRKTKHRIQCTSCLGELLHVLQTYEASNDPTKLISNLSPWFVMFRPHRPADYLSKLLLLPGGLWEKMWWERMGWVSGWPFGHDKTGKFGPSSCAAPTRGTVFPNSDILIYQTAILHDAGTSGVETGEHGLERR